MHIRRITRRSRPLIYDGTCSDGDVSANDRADAVDGRALVYGPVDVLPEGLRFEGGEVYRPVAEDVPDGDDARYAAAVRR